MRWNQLFADLEAQFEALADVELRAEFADRQRVATGAVPMTQRLTGALGGVIRLRLAGGIAVSGTLRQVGPDWVLLAEAEGRDVVCALAATTIVEGLTSATGRSLDAVALRIDLRLVLRGVARDRSPVSVWVSGLEAVPGGATEIAGTIDRIGADFLELAVHAPWEPRRAASVRSVVLIPLPAVLMVRAMPMG